ncbi:hypothetical protein [Paractinoplanes deccanensis]|uniref:hypothetical protein n=1 Tax=Paractinoplanes deccanensis TaxID=113561 RepID=UPI001943A169|nr:hypothetical protein [Actinoplanes deccanensis]
MDAPLARALRGAGLDPADVDLWCRLFFGAERQIDVLAYSALFLAEDIAVSAVLCDKARAGVRLRIALGEPAGTHVAVRGGEERVGDGMAARIRTALIAFGAVVDAGAELRLHDTVLYNSIYRSDDELLINTHVYGHPGAHAPLLHLMWQGDEGLARTYADSFERVWSASRPIVT